MIKIKLIHPLISCICITDNRPSILLRAIIIFDVQTYPNRELVISYPSRDYAIRELIEKIIQLSDMRILLIERKDNLSKGMAKNEAVTKCSGDYICIWDDQNWYHSNRLMHQFNILRAKAWFCEASILTHVTLYDEINHKACISTPYNGSGSLLCKKIVVEYKFEDTNDKANRQMIKCLETKKFLDMINDAASSFVYVFPKAEAYHPLPFSFFSANSKLFNIESTDVIFKLNISFKLSE